MWDNAVLRQPGQPATRGFGGRVIFFKEGQSDPIQVDGTLVVYAFEETDGGPISVKPDRKFVFHRDQFPKHYGESALGPAYSFWLPWDEAGGPAKTVSLIAQFNPRQGPPLTSDASKHVLPGPSPLEEERVQTSLQEAVDRLSREKTELEERLLELQQQLQEVRAQLAKQELPSDGTITESLAAVASRLSETLSRIPGRCLRRQGDLLVAQATDFGRRGTIRRVGGEIPLGTSTAQVRLPCREGPAATALPFPSLQTCRDEPNRAGDGLTEPLPFDPLSEQRPSDVFDELPIPRSLLEPPLDLPLPGRSPVTRSVGSGLAQIPPLPSIAGEDEIDDVLLTEQLPPDWRSRPPRPWQDALRAELPVPPPFREEPSLDEGNGLCEGVGDNPADDLVLLPSRPELELPEPISLYDVPADPWEPQREPPGVEDPIGRDEPDLAGIPGDGDAYRILAQAAKVYQTKLAVIANNLANAETPGFKRVRVNLENLPSRHEHVPGTMDSAGHCAPVGLAVGIGVRAAGSSTDFRQGALQEGGQLDVAITGAGFFQVTSPTGEILYTRAGCFSKNANGDLVLASSDSGCLLEPCITIPRDATEVLISPEGMVSVRTPAANALSQIGQIELARFVNPQGLLSRGENLYAETEASGTPSTGHPGQDGMGRLHQGKLETSNVDSTEELIEWKRTADRLKGIRQLLHVEFRSEPW
jgi:flagellar basal-body rod protein FlgG